MTSPGPPSDKWVTQLRKGVLELCILNAIAGGRLYGYEIAKVLGDSQGPDVREGTVYPILSRLRKLGWLKASIVESAEGPPRKYYELTAAGRHQLERMNEAWDQLHGRIRSLRRRSPS